MTIHNLFKTKESLEIKTSVLQEEACPRSGIIPLRAPLSDMAYDIPSLSLHPSPKLVAASGRGQM